MGNFNYRRHACKIIMSYIITASSRLYITNTQIGGNSVHRRQEGKERYGQSAPPGGIAPANQGVNARMSAVGHDAYPITPLGTGSSLSQSAKAYLDHHHQRCFGSAGATRLHSCNGDIKNTRKSVKRSTIEDYQLMFYGSSFERRLLEGI